jgi:hypothetical protein
VDHQPAGFFFTESSKQVYLFFAEIKDKDDDVSDEQFYKRQPYKCEQCTIEYNEEQFDGAEKNKHTYFGDDYLLYLVIGLVEIIEYVERL